MKKHGMDSFMEYNLSFLTILFDIRAYSKYRPFVLIDNRNYEDIFVVLQTSFSQ